MSPAAEWSDGITLSLFSNIIAKSIALCVCLPQKVLFTCSSTMQFNYVLEATSHLHQSIIWHPHAPELAVTVIYTLIDRLFGREITNTVSEIKQVFNFPERLTIFLSQEPEKPISVQQIRW